MAESDLAESWSLLMEAPSRVMQCALMQRRPRREGGELALTRDRQLYLGGPVGRGGEAWGGHPARRESASAL